MLTERSCGGCTKCCELVPVKALNKPGWVVCQHMRSVLHAEGPGCGIYRARPRACANWQCLWLKSPQMNDAMRPDRLGIVIDEDLDLIQINGKDTPCAQIWVGAGREQSFDDELVSDIIVRLFKQNLAVLWRLPGGKEARAFAIVDGRLVISENVPAWEQKLGPEGERQARAAQLLRQR